LRGWRITMVGKARQPGRHRAAQCEFRGHSRTPFSSQRHEEHEALGNFFCVIPSAIVQTFRGVTSLAVPEIHKLRSPCSPNVGGEMVSPFGGNFGVVSSPAPSYSPSRPGLWPSSSIPLGTSLWKVRSA
jgi:hypothetical protein